MWNGIWNGIWNGMWNGLWNGVRAFTPYSKGGSEYRNLCNRPRMTLQMVQGLGMHASCSKGTSCWIYSHTLSLQDIRLFKIVTTQVWISTFLLEHTTYKDHTWKDNHTHIYWWLCTCRCTIWFKTTVRRLVWRLHVSTHDKQDSVDCKCLLESVGSQGQSLDHMTTECTAHCNGSGM